MITVHAHARLGATVNRKAKSSVKGAERRFRELDPSGSRSRQTRAYPGYPASQATSEELTEYEHPTGENQSYHLSHAAATDGTQSRAPGTLGVVDVFTSFSSHLILFLPLSITFLVSVS
jgi:hypothetical protein